VSAPEIELPTLTLKPTRELIELQGVTFRIWAGKDAHGVEVRALVSALVVENHVTLRGHENLIEQARPMALKDSELARLCAACTRTGLRPDTL